jgi:CBS domain containing-hemolysin-like protein
MLVTASAEGGVVGSEESEMLHAIFNINNLLVRQVMNPRTEVTALEADTSLENSIAVAIESTFSKFPVYQDDLDTILGVVHIRDLLRAQQDPDRKNSTARTLAREALFVPESLPLKNVLQQLRDRRQHIAIVIDEFGGTAGVVTLEDIMEEIIGEVSDPFDSPHPEIQVQADGTVIIEGLALIEEVNEKLELTLDAPHYDTIAGYVLGMLDRMPEIGDSINIGLGLCLKVIKMDGMRIEQLSLSRVEKAPADA